ncbi:MAG: DNA-binding protein [Planctomycetes bacterium DG_20]|nr:MAG: DNA-binding protein [Planctomycetes bacterium DG_20]
MTEDQRELLEGARESLAAARLLLDAGHFGFAASRAYYAMFHVAEAFLEGEELAFSKHSAVIAAFGKVFAKSGRVPPEFHRFLAKAFELRRDGDYGGVSAVSQHDAKQTLDHAARFLELAAQRIGPLPDEERDAP